MAPRKAGSDHHLVVDFSFSFFSSKGREWPPPIGGFFTEKTNVAQ